MNADLEAIKAAYIVAGDNANQSDEEVKAEHDHVRELAQAYVTAHPTEFNSANFGGIDLNDVEQLVTAVDVFRAAGFEETVWRLEAWLLYHVPPQDIGGTYKASVNVGQIIETAQGEQEVAGS